jgi:UDP-glucose 4-epimerase
LIGNYRHCVVTGARGFIGQHLVQALLSRGITVTIVTRTPIKEVPTTGIEVKVADLRDPIQSVACFDGADLVFHSAANANTTRSVLDPRYDFESNALVTFNCLEASQRVGVRRFVYVSSASVYGKPEYFPIDEKHPTHPFMPYGASKLSGELSCRVMHLVQGLETVIGRLFCVYGPGEDPYRAMVEVSRFLRWHLNDQPIPVIGNAERKTRDFVHVDDAVQGLLLLAEYGGVGEAYNIGSGSEISMEKLAHTISDITGRPHLLQQDQSITDDTYRLVADISKLRSLGYQPKVNLDEGVRRLLAWMGERPALPGCSTIFKAGQSGEPIQLPQSVA